MKCSLANPNIAPHIRETLKSYEEHGFLDTFFTSYYFDSHSRLNRFVERYIPSVTKELRRRCIEAIPSERVRSRPLPEFLRVLSSRKFSCKITDQIWEWGELGFDRWVASRLDPTLDWVHTSEHAGLETLKRAKKLGIMSIHEQPSLHHQFFSQIIARQTALYPAFDSGVTQLLYDENSVRRNRRRDAELSLADHILCNSQFTKTTLVNGGVDEAKIITVPLGFPAVQERGERASNDKIRFMYAGNIAFGKGIHLLLEAWREIRSDLIELWLIGNVALPSSLLQDLPDNIRFIPRLPHSELMNTYQSADVFIHPTLADGFGMVIAEAMSRGLPVITTTHSGGADLIDEKVDGLVIPAESKASITGAISWCVENKNLLPLMGEKARTKAAAYPWSSYRKRLVSEIVQRKAVWVHSKKSA